MINICVYEGLQHKLAVFLSDRCWLIKLYVNYPNSITTIDNPFSIRLNKVNVVFLIEWWFSADN